MSARRVAVGLVGAGPWATFVHAPMLARGAHTRLAGIWARRPEAAATLAAHHGAEAFERFEALLDHCEAVAFAVPPDVQADLGVRAARAGKALLLEKPLALDLAAARRLADAAGEAGVPTQLMLTWRYTEPVRTFLAAVAGVTPLGGRAHFLSGAFLAGPFATPWRLTHGPLLDLGPHVLDLLDAALGPVVRVRASGDPRTWVGLLLEHESGLASEVSLTGSSNLQPMRAGAAVHAREGVLEVDGATAVTPGTFATVADEFAACVAAGRSHGLCAARGLALQELLESARTDLLRRR